MPGGRILRKFAAGSLAPKFPTASKESTSPLAAKQRQALAMSPGHRWFLLVSVCASFVSCLHKFCVHLCAMRREFGF